MAEGAWDVVKGIIDAPQFGDDDGIADLYADDLSRAPFDQARLDRFAELGQGTVCDLGCGPGHVGEYLRLRGVEIFGVDLSPRMIDVARRRYPPIPFQIGDMRTLHNNGRLLLGCHRAQQDLHVDERFGQLVSLDATLFEPDEVERYAAEAGFDVEGTLTGRPDEFEVQVEKITCFR